MVLMRSWPRATASWARLISARSLSARSPARLKRSVACSASSKSRSTWAWAPAGGSCGRPGAALADAAMATAAQAAAVAAAAVKAVSFVFRSRPVRPLGPGRLMGRHVKPLPSAVRGPGPPSVDGRVPGLRAGRQ